MTRYPEHRDPWKADEWHSLLDGLDLKAKPTFVAGRPAGGSPPAGHGQPALQQSLDSDKHLLACDLVCNLVDPLRDRQKRLGMPARRMQLAKNGLVKDGLVKEVWVGKVLLPAPTPELYETLGMKSPYRNNRWDIHSFLVLAAAKLIEPDSLVKYIVSEVPLSGTGSSLDLGVYLKDGRRWAYEIVHKCVTNVSSHAAKLQGHGFSLVVFLCTDFNVKQRVWKLIRDAGFPPSYLSTIRCQLFSSLIRRRKELMLKNLL